MKTAEKQLTVKGYKGIDPSLDAYANSPFFLSKAEKAKEHLSKIKNLEFLDKK